MSSIEGLAQQPVGSPAVRKASSSDSLDTEMTCPLTLDEKEYTVSPSPSPSPPNDEDMFNGRDRSSTNGYSANNQNTGFGHGHPGQGTSSLQGHSNSVQNVVFTRPELWRDATDPAGQQFNRSINSNGAVTGFQSQSYDPAVPGLMPNRLRSNSSMMPMIENDVPLHLVSPGPAWPTEHQLSIGHAYAIRNEDGSYTRLIRADDLDRFVGFAIPPRQTSEGLIILPPTRCPSPNSRRGKEQLVPRSVSFV